MKLPTRPETHIIETDSMRLLQQLAPREWIVREVTERDYGIDCYIEITSKSGELTGDLISVQLKGVKKVDWKSNADNVNECYSPYVKVSTANYWLSLPVPVFMFVADLKLKNIHFVPVKEHLRSNFSKLETQNVLVQPKLEKSPVPVSNFFALTLN